MFFIVALLAFVIVRLPWNARMSHGVALDLLMAGIVGNLYDRIVREPVPQRGHVIDFFELPHFAIFNAADTCITSAAELVIWLSLRDRAANYTA